MADRAAPSIGSVWQIGLERLRSAAPGAARWLWARRLEVLAFLAVLALCIVVRVVKLGTIPRVITADETDNLQDAYKIIAGTSGGIFGFDWKPSPLLGLYPLAWSIQFFGNSVSDFRMYPVIFSLLTIVLFYVLARESLGALAALGAMVLLGTNLWFLHFSRTAWDNMDAACVAVGACWCLTRALKTRRDRWWFMLGVFMAAGLYGYFSGRFLFLAVAGACALAVVLKQAPWRETLVGLLIAAFVGAALFAPMAAKIASNWAYFNRRTNDVSVFNLKQPYEGDTSSWVVVEKNLGRNFRGFILQDGAEMSRGLWKRYNPQGRPPLDVVSTYLFWGGLIVAAARWRRTYLWWPFFVPLFSAEVFSTGTPDLARGLVFAPFYFLFIGVLFDWVLGWRLRPLVRGGVLAGLVAVVALVAVLNVKDYFDWQTNPKVQAARLPGADRCEFNLYQTLARRAAAMGVLMESDPQAQEWDLLRRELNCSSIVRQYLR